MGKIIISDNVSLDGVIQDPAGEEGFRLGGWAGRPAAREETAQVLLDEALGTQALLFGRRSYEFGRRGERDLEAEAAARRGHPFGPRAKATGDDLGAVAGVARGQDPSRTAHDARGDGKRRVFCLHRARLPR
jgi:hypothetical protein